MKIEISNQIENQLYVLKNKMLFLSLQSMLFVIGEHEITTETKKVTTGLIFKSEKEETKKYLTKMDLWSWNSDGKFWGLAPDDTIERIVNWYDLYKLRNSYITNIKEPFEKLGLKMIFNPENNRTIE